MLTYEGKQVYAVREVKAENFHPMVRPLINERFARQYVQIDVDVIGGREWINVRRDDLKVVENECVTIMRRQVGTRFETIADQVEHYIVMLIDLPVQSLAQVQEVLNMMKLFVGISEEDEAEVLRRCARRWLY